MKKTLITLSVGLALSAVANADVLITEYVEGGSYNKAIELYNNGVESVSLSNYTLARYKDGSTTPTEMVSLNGTLAAQELLVVQNNLAELSLSSDVATIISSGLVHNGGDAVALLNNGIVVDIVGDVPTTSGWGKDITLRRIGRTASAVYDESDWSDYAKDTFDGLGSLSDETTDNTIPDATATTIMQIQGEFWSSPLIDSGYESQEYFEVTGIVTAIQTSALGNDLPVGFFLQDQYGDGNDNTSDAIFVKGDINGIEVGNTVTVQGKAYESYGWTQLIDTHVNHIEPTQITITPTPLRKLDTDESFDFTLERHEGMLIELDQAADMHITRTFSFDYDAYRYNMMASYERVNLQMNQKNVPGSVEALAQDNENKDRRIYIESFQKAANGVVPWYSEFLAESAIPMEDGTTTSDDYIRIDDTINGLQGVLGYSYSDFRLYVTNQATQDTFIHNNDRTTAPDVADGDLRVATFNVLNYFNSPFGGAENPYGDNRGAETFDEFERQGDKIAKAIVSMDADIVGLMEIENNGFGEESAVAHLVNKINLLIQDESDQYSYVSSEDYEYVGTDAITNQVIFKPSKVTLDTYRLIKMPEQHATEGEDTDNYQRDAITPTFRIKGSDETITVSVNHFKSKGSTCWEDVNLQNDEDPDGQGSCENFRVSAAQHLGTELAKIDGHKLILGDLNSYASEDPILLLTDLPDGYSVTPARDTFIGSEEMDGAQPESLTQSFGYRNVIREIHPDSYSYSYDDTLGTLDYILADADTAENNVVDAIDWNINSPESTYVDYSTEYSGDLPKYYDIYRASDHDPAVVVLAFGKDDKHKPGKHPNHPNKHHKHKNKHNQSDSKHKNKHNHSDNRNKPKKPWFQGYH
ncbi:ExeM/NucH family extracellular endonuclease [uncultured Vibrio sp.]|uniref:ExeM/NucH family extracellular endonuclease n=1 Tax=uncultured Vibrio sp. TaxID=114054 RepID=UPI0029C74B2E|nr:ExeM/NucH family extracellular endonuclease [uncultured Vibrio sp.]